MMTALRLPLAVFPLGVTIASAADNYPSRPIRMISPNPAGGANDVIGRIVAQKMSEILGQRMVVDNRAGAGGTIGADFAAKAAPAIAAILAGEAAFKFGPMPATAALIKARRMKAIAVSECGMAAGTCATQCFPTSVS